MNEHHSKSLTEYKNSSDECRTVISILDMTLSEFRSQYVKNKTVLKHDKKELPSEEQFRRTRLPRTENNDRMFPLETINKESFNAKHDADIHTSVIVYGPSADELARSNNALAVTIGTAIYFRNGAYKPETEEGRQTLAHELTHVQQYEEHRITAQTTEKELETEAELAEKKEQYDPDPFQPFPVCGKIFYYRKSQIDKILHRVADEIESWVEHQRYTMCEEKYLEFLCRYKGWLES
jgi:hypothetical protein